jgi:hypothetical protein
VDKAVPIVNIWKTLLRIYPTNANMAALNAKKRVFESVFSSQLSPPVSSSSQAADQAHWDRSWRVVTQALSLQPIPNDRDQDPFKSLQPSSSPDGAFDEALKDLLNQENRIPQANQTPDLILWYTNHVRRHYLNQIFPIIQRLRNQASAHPKNPEVWVKACVHILEGAHRLYFEGLGLLVGPLKDARAVVKNFRLNLSTVVSNSITDREAIRLVVKQHVSAILSRSVVESDFLELVKSLNSVGLGGEKYVSHHPLNCPFFQTARV